MQDVMIAQKLPSNRTEAVDLVAWVKLIRSGGDSDRQFPETAESIWVDFAD
jgi:hypothetical protein